MGESARKGERVQTGVRIEKRVLQVLKALAVHHGIGLGDLLEGIVLHAFEGKAPFGEQNLAFIAHMKQAYGLDLTSEDSRLLVEEIYPDDEDTYTPDQDDDEEYVGG